MQYKYIKTSQVCLNQKQFLYLHKAMAELQMISLPLHMQPSSDSAIQYCLNMHTYEDTYHDLTFPSQLLDESVSSLQPVDDSPCW